MLYAHFVLSPMLQVPVEADLSILLCDRLWRVITLSSISAMFPTFMLWSIGHFINFQNILHAGYKFCIFFKSNTAIGVFVMLKFIFLTSDKWFPSLPKYQIQHGLFVLKVGVSSRNVHPMSLR